jgi:uracil-DNA glycosylase
MSHSGQELLAAVNFLSCHTNLTLAESTSLHSVRVMSFIFQLSQFLVAERASHTVYPPEDQVWTWTHTCPMSQVKVVILGQDPYHNPRQAHGTAFLNCF